MCTGIEIKFKQALYPVMIAATHIPELNSVEFTSDGIRFGASVTLATIEDTLRSAIGSDKGMEVYQQFISFNLDSAF